MKIPPIKHREKGLTLVELMIALTLSMVLMGGVMVLFTGNKVSYRIQEGLAAIQDSGRYAVSQMKRDIESAGFGGCLTTGFQLDAKAVKPPALRFDAPQYVKDFADGIKVTGQNDVSGATVDGTTVVDGTDVLQITGPMNDTVYPVSHRIYPNVSIQVQGDARSALPNGELAVIGDCEGTDIIKVTSAPSYGSGTTTFSRSPALLSRKFNSDALVAPFGTRTYFVGLSVANNSSNEPVRALFRSDGTTAQEILQGVEDMQITYGLDTDFDGRVDEIQDASAVTQWSNVVSARIALLINSIDETAEKAASYIYLPNGSTPVTPVAGDLLMRQEYSSVLTIRNNVF